MAAPLSTAPAGAPARGVVCALSAAGACVAALRVGAAVAGAGLCGEPGMGVEATAGAPWAAMRRRAMRLIGAEAVAGAEAGAGEAEGSEAAAGPRGLGVGLAGAAWREARVAGGAAWPMRMLAASASVSR